ncbi:MAG: hypothetical protein ABFR62_06210 [Bacteroidota bacterium]
MKKNIKNSALSPEKYIKTKARTLDIKNCYISENWKSAGLATIIVSRQHKNSNVTHALYQIDLLAEGVVNTFFEFNLGGENYDKVIKYYIKEQNLIECSYDLAHQVIYEAYFFAEEFKLKAHKDFAITKFLLEPEDYEPAEEYDFEIGEDNKPLVIVSTDNNKKDLIAKLKKNVGESNFKVINIEDLDKEDHDHSHEHEHDHHHHNESDENSFDLPDFAKPTDVLNKENIDNWTEQDWQDFEDGKVEVSAKTTLQIIDFMYDSHFPNEKSDIIDKNNLDINKLNISIKPIEENNFFKNDDIEKEIKSVFVEMLEKPSEKHIEYFEKMIKDYPKNPQLYSYLSNTYIKLGRIDLSDKWTEIAFNKFPDYLFGQISFAQTLLQKGEYDKVPEVFHKKTDLKRLLPERKQFHMLEVVNYYSIMCLYFTTQKDIASANIYWNKLKELDEREEELVLLAENELMVAKAKILKGA